MPATIQRNLMNFYEGLAAVIVAIGGLIVGLPPAINAISNYQIRLRKQKIEEDRAKLEEEKERAILADKLGVTPDQSLNKLVTLFVERLDKENSDLRERVVLLEQGKAQRDKQIETLQEGQRQSEARMSEMVEANRQLVEVNEKLVQENDQLRKENAQLKTDNATIKADNSTIKSQLRKMIQELQKAQLPLPDGVEHEGNGEKESGGGG